MIKLKACRKYSKKRCIVFLSFYCFCILFLSFCLRDRLSMNKHENCTIQNADIFEKEKKIIMNVDAYLEKLFLDIVIENTSVSHKWTQISSDIYVYSAFFEICPSHLSLSSLFCIKFIAIALANSTSVSPFSNNLKCAVKNNLVVSTEEYATVELLPESHDKLFSASFIFCPVKSSYPTHAVVYRSNSNLISWLSVANHKISNYNLSKYENKLNSHGINFPQGISLCVRPLYNNFVIVNFIEFLAYYSVMGVNHFIFYYHKSFKPLKTFLKTLKFSNVSSEVYLWDIPLDNNLIHEYGQIAFTQDCLAHSKNKFRHSIVVDLDEYIVPKAHKDIKSLISYLDETNAYAGSYVIPMVLFCNEYAVQNSHVFPFHILNYNKRQRTHWLHHYRSKYIVRPDRVRYSGIHFTWELESNFEEVFVSPNVAVVNHYKYCCGMTQTWFFHLFEFNVLNDKVMVDNTLISHKDKLINHHLFKFIINISLKNVL